MSKNINTLSENINTLTSTVKDAMLLLSGYGDVSSSNDSSISVTLSDGSKVSMPAYSNVIKRLDRVEDTVSAFTQGGGMVETDDGTFRKVKVTTVPKSPATITALPAVTSFNIDANWFFEDFMFPKIVVPIDLKGMIDDNSDRAYIVRVILDYTDADTVKYYEDELKGTDVSYSQLIEKLNKDGISYSEDRQEVSLPLVYEKFYGDFEITEIKNDRDDNGNEYLWYYLDSINYKMVDDNGLVMSSSYRLSNGDYLRYNDSLYKIKKIDQASKRIVIEFAVGYETPSVGTSFHVYNEPFAEKIINVGIGHDEINILYVKGVDENYNIVSRDWSNPSMFITNDLTLGSTLTTLTEYYKKNVMDLGKEWIAKAKEGRIYAYNGMTPNPPTLSEEYLKVVQINTQLEATLESETYNNLKSSIFTAKSTVEDLRKTIASDKERLVKSTDADERTTIQNTINNNTESLSTETTKYNSLVEEMNTLLNENGAIGYTPKYHVRGFFPIPDSIENNGVKEEVIGFDIMYRYVHTDDTGTELNTFTYSDGNNTTSAVFSDWNVTTSKIKEQVYDDDLGIYVWSDEEVGDGNAININQIDIPIRSGEKVQIKVRSISEAGYPNNPLKSAWSNVVTIAFPDNLSSNDSVTTTIDKAKDDMTSVVLQNTLSAAGLYTHIQDSNESYKHTAKGVSVTYKIKDDNEVKTVPLTEFLKILAGSNYEIL